MTPSGINQYHGNYIQSLTLPYHNIFVLILEHIAYPTTQSSISSTSTTVGNK